MRRYAVLTLTVSAIFLLIVGAFLNAPPLFYMSTVMITTLLGLRAQASLATLGLRFERIAPTVIAAGELISIRIRVWSTLRIRRPLLFITDELPPSFAHDVDTRPLPVAPSYEEAVETRYDLRPHKRGIYRWSRICVRSTDSLGLISVAKTYQAEPIDVIIHPAKIPFAFDLVALSGWGANQADEGRNRGQGMEPRGVREFSPGDSLRHIHWRTTARMTTIQVVEFETGFNTNLIVLLQLTDGSEAGAGVATSLEAMCGHAAFLADVMLTRGSKVSLPNLERDDALPAHSSAIRYRQVCDALASARADRHLPFAASLERTAERLAPGSTVVVMLSAAEPGVADAVRRLAVRAHVVAVLYDPTGYAGRGLAAALLPATDPDFMASLAGSNVTIQVMTNPFVQS